MLPSPLVMFQEIMPPCADSGVGWGEKGNRLWAMGQALGHGSAGGFSPGTILWIPFFFILG